MDTYVFDGDKDTEFMKKYIKSIENMIPDKYYFITPKIAEILNIKDGDYNFIHINKLMQDNSIIEVDKAYFDTIVNPIKMYQPYDFNRGLSDWFPSQCKNCSNHPKNGGSGVCHCILGQQTIY